MPFDAPGHQWIKNFVVQMLRHARAIVYDLHHHGQAMAFFNQRNLPCDARAQHDGAVAMHGLGGVANEVEHYLDQLLLVAMQRRQADVVVALNN